MVKSIRHLGNNIENKLDGMRQDMREKRARFIQKNNELCQEFSYADPITKIKLNSIYNNTLMQDHVAKQMGMRVLYSAQVGVRTRIGIRPGNQASGSAADVEDEN